MSIIVVVDPSKIAPEDLLVFPLEEPNKGFFIKLLEDTGSEWVEISGTPGTSIQDRLMARALQLPPVLVPPLAPARKRTRKKKGKQVHRKRCPECGELFHKNGFATHLASHRNPKAVREATQKAREARALKRHALESARRTLEEGPPAT